MSYDTPEIISGQVGPHSYLFSNWISFTLYLFNFWLELSRDLDPQCPNGISFTLYLFNFWLNFSSSYLVTLTPVSRSGEGEGARGLSPRPASNHAPGPAPTTRKKKFTSLTSSGSLCALFRGLSWQFIMPTLAQSGFVSCFIWICLWPYLDLFGAPSVNLELFSPTLWFLV